MQYVWKNRIIAIHRDDQELVGKYPASIVLRSDTRPAFDNDSDEPFELLPTQPQQFLDDTGLEFFLPCQTNLGFNILAVWTKNKTEYAPAYFGQFWAFYKRHRAIFRNNNWIIMTTIWTKNILISLTMKKYYT